jgi:hypothetical protein
LNARKFTIIVTINAMPLANILRIVFPVPFLQGIPVFTSHDIEENGQNVLVRIRFARRGPQIHGGLTERTGFAALGMRRVAWIGIGSQRTNHAIASIGGSQASIDVTVYAKCWRNGFVNHIPAQPEIFDRIGGAKRLWNASNKTVGGDVKPG